MMKSTDGFYAYWTIEKDGSLSGNDPPNRQLSVVLGVVTVEDEFNFDWYVRRVALGCQR